MSRYQHTLTSEKARLDAIRVLKAAPLGSRVEIKGQKRTVPQNDRMWALLTLVALNHKHHGQRLSPDDWKVIFMDHLPREYRQVPNLENNGFVTLGRSTSQLSKDEMSDLMTLIEMFCARHGIEINECEAA